MISAISTTTNISFNGKHSMMRKMCSSPNNKIAHPNNIQNTPGKPLLKDTFIKIKKAFSDEEYLSKLSPKEREKIEKQWQTEKLADRIAFIILAICTAIAPIFFE